MKRICHPQPGRLDNLPGFAYAEKAGLKHEAVFIDLLVFPVATDSNNASLLDAFPLSANTALKYISGGFSNAFGMPNRN